MKKAEYNDKRAEAGQRYREELRSLKKEFGKSERERIKNKLLKCFDFD